MADSVDTSDEVSNDMFSTSKEIQRININDFGTDQITGKSIVADLDKASKVFAKYMDDTPGLGIRGEPQIAPISHHDIVPNNVKISSDREVYFAMQVAKKFTDLGNAFVNVTAAFALGKVGASSELLTQSIAEQESDVYDIVLE